MKKFEVSMENIKVVKLDTSHQGDRSKVCYDIEIRKSGFLIGTANISSYTWGVLKTGGKAWVKLNEPHPWEGRYDLFLKTNGEDNRKTNGLKKRSALLSPA